MRLLSRLKSCVVPRGIRPRAIAGGIYRGLTLEVDLSHQTQLYLGLWERETYKYLRQAAARCAWAIDVGAGQGELCVYLLRHSRAETIYAFEPKQSEREGLSRNLALNGITDLSALRVRSEFLGRAPGAGVTTLDSLELPRQRRGFLKVDVDGAEMDVLCGGERLLAEAPMDVIVETHSQELERECIEWLTRQGFHVAIVKNAWWRAIAPEMRPIGHNRWLWATKPV